MHLNNWRLHRRSPKRKKRIRLRRKERLTWQEWFQDWYRALHSLGWTCRNQGINPDRLRLTEDELSELSVLYMQKDTTVVHLYPWVETLPRRGTICDGWMSCIKPITKVVRIVRGRRPDAVRGVTRVGDGTATRVIPNWNCTELEPFLVDFDRGLFEPRTNGDWGGAQDEEAQCIYDAYLETSPHLMSFRKYMVTPKLLSPLDTLMGRGSIPVGEQWEPLNRLK
jgi:hypothetical protein